MTTRRSVFRPTEEQIKQFCDGLLNSLLDLSRQEAAIHLAVEQDVDSEWTWDRPYGDGVWMGGRWTVQVGRPASLQKHADDCERVQAAEVLRRLGVEEKGK